MGTIILIAVLVIVGVCFIGYLMAQYEEGRAAAEHRRERKRQR